jgi:hypothetical protein
MIPRWRSAVDLLFLTCAVLLLPRAAFAARILGISIQVDGKPHLAGRAWDSGSPPKAAVWRYLTSTELRPEGVEVPSDPSDPLKATLRGKITINVRYGAKAEVQELHLVRRALNAAWTVDPDDVERIAKGIGLEEIPVLRGNPSPELVRTDQTASPVPDGFPWFWAVGSGAAVVLAVGIGGLVARGRTANRL